MNTNSVSTPTNDDTPTSFHKNNVATIVSKGPIQRKGIYNSDLSNRFTSFDIRFMIWPDEVRLRETALSRNACGKENFMILQKKYEKNTLYLIIN